MVARAVDSPLGLEIKRKRRAMGETQASLAGLLGVDRSTVGEWERGETQPSPQSMRGLIRQGILTRADAGRLIRFPDEGPTSAHREFRTAENGEREASEAIQADTPSLSVVADKLNAQNVHAPDFDGRPAIAVLAFENISNDGAQDYFADGITEDVMDGLGRWRWFPIIAGASRGAGGSPDFRQLGQELGARYVVKGSVRRMGGRMRLSVNLIDAESRMRLWGEQFDRDVKDIFVVQDDITRKIVSHCAPQIMMAESERAARVRPHSVNAWDSLARGLWFHHRFTKDDNEHARDHFNAALAADPSSALPLAWLAATHMWDFVLSWSPEPARSLSMGLDAASRAVALDNTDTTARLVLSACFTYTGNQHRGVEEGEKAIELNPSLALAHASHGWALVCVGQASEALLAMRTCRRLSPHDPYRAHFLSVQSLAHILLGEFEEAVVCAQSAIQESPSAARARHRLACALAHMGEVDRARDALEESRRMLPDFNQAYIDTTHPFVRSADRDLFVEGLRKAGWRG